MAVIIALCNRRAPCTVFGTCRATDPNPAAIGKDPLVLNGYPPCIRGQPHGVTDHIGGLGPNANVTAKLHRQPRERFLGRFPTHRVAIEASIVLMANDHIYARHPTSSNGPWDEDVLHNACSLSGGLT